MGASVEEPFLRYAGVANLSDQARKPSSKEIEASNSLDAKNQRGSSEEQALDMCDKFIYRCRN